MLACPASADGAAEARAFFDRYVERAAAFDASIGELYAADARIVTLRDGTRRLETSGAELAEIVGRVMPLARKRGDVSRRFDDVKITRHGDGFRVTATRVPAVKCGPDEGYRVDVAKVEGAWRIVEEYSETVSLSRCPPSRELAKASKDVRKGIEPHLPLALDADSRLEAVEIAGPALIYRQRLHTATLSELDHPAAVQALKRVGFQSACGVAAVKALVDRGATVRYSTVDREGALIADVDIAPGMCP